MRTMWVLCATVMASAGACGGSDESGYVACSSFAGKSATAETFTACVVDTATADQTNLPTGSVFLPGTARRLCEDGRVLIWNDLGWGYENALFTLAEDGLPPTSETDICSTEP